MNSEIESYAIWNICSFVDLNVQDFELTIFSVFLDLNGSKNSKKFEQQIFLRTAGSTSMVDATVLQKC